MIYSIVFVTCVNRSMHEGIFQYVPILVNDKSYLAINFDFLSLAFNGLGFEFGVYVSFSQSGLILQHIIY